jgi:hypothetical protein
MYMHKPSECKHGKQCIPQIKFDSKIIRDTGETDPTEPTESIQRGPGSGTSEAPLTYTNDMGGVADSKYFYQSDLRK